MQISQDAFQVDGAGSNAEKPSSLESSRRAENKTDWLYLSFVIGCALFPLLARLYLLLLTEPLNVDEAQWAVSARQIFDDLILWRRNDLTTSGPLNAVVVAWPNLFGVLPSIVTSRLTGLLLQSAAMLCLALLIRPKTLFSAGMAATLMSVAFLSTNINGNFNHYSSEDLSIAMIAAFCLLFATAKPGDASALRWLGCGLLATSLVFAKMQSALFSGLFHACCLLRFGIEAHRGAFSWRNFAAYAFGALLPLLVLVAPLFFVGEQDAFLTGYLGLGANYEGRRSLYLFGYGGFLCLTVVSGLALLSVLAGLVERSRWPTLDRIDLLILSLGLWPVTFLTIWLPGHKFHHYLLYGCVALPLSCILAERALPLSRENPTRRRYLAAAFCFLLAGYIVYQLPKMARCMSATAEGLAFARDGDSRSLFAWAGIGPGDRVIMWGWDPRLLAFAGVKSVDRTTHAEYLIRPNHGREYFRARLLRDLEGENPALTFDTMRDGYFFQPDRYVPPAQSTLRSFPALFERVAASSVEITRRPECAAVYLRRDKAELLKRAEVPLQGNEFNLQQIEKYISRWERKLFIPTNIPTDFAATRLGSSTGPARIASQSVDAQ